MTATTSNPKKSRAALWIVIVGLALALVVVATVAAALGSDGPGYFEGADETNDLEDDTSSSDLDDLYDDCDDGDMTACDDLYFDSPVGSSEEEFGSTCGGRVNYELEGECEEEF